MNRQTWARGISEALAAVLWLIPAGHAQDSGESKDIRIGLMRTLFRDMPASQLEVLSLPLKTLMQSQTGMTGELVIVGDAFDLAKKLKENKFQLGFFHGFEFAWARQRNPGLKPLVVVVVHHRQLHAHLVVRKDCPASRCADLKGKVVAIPYDSRQHCHLYLERRCPGNGTDPKKFFGQVTRPGGIEDALDDVIEGTAQAAVVDRHALEQYQQDKPDRSRRLRVLVQSETFPTSVIAYQEGSLDKSTLRRFQERLIGANKTARGRELLRLSRITAFEEMPSDYDQLLKDIARVYPPPARK